MKKIYEEFLSNLRNNPRVKLDDELEMEFIELDPFSIELGVEMLVDDSWKLPENISNYLNLSDLCVSWESTLKNVDFALNGGFKFNGIVDALTMPSNFWKGAFSIAPGNEVPAELHKFKSLGWFEHQAWEDGRYGCFDISEKVFPPKITFYSRGWFTYMNITFDEYLIKMFEMYAIKGWQFFFIDVTADIPYLEEVLEDMRLASEQLPLLFPDKDWTIQINKYEETLKKLGK